MGCDNTIDFDKGPCKFAPPESKFPIFPATYCTECYFNLKFSDKEYSFAGSQLEAGGPGAGPGWSPDRNIQVQNTWNSFLSFYLVSPSSDELLSNSIGVKTPRLKLDTLSKLISAPPSVSASFGIYNYCNDFFEPITGDVSQSYNQLTDIELMESYYVGSIDGSIEQYQNHFFYCYGEITATFVINGEKQLVTATYKVRAQIWEEL